MAPSIAKGITNGYLPGAGLVTDVRDFEPGPTATNGPDAEPWPAMAGEGTSAGRPAVFGEHASERRRSSRAVKIAVVVAGVFSLALAGILMGIPGFQITLDPVPDPDDDRTRPPAAALSRTPVTTPAPITPASGPPATSAPHSTTPSLSTTPSSTAAAAGVPPTAPGAVRPQGAGVSQTRGPRPRSVRPQAVRPRRTSVVTRYTSDSAESSSTSPQTSATGAPGGRPTTTSPTPTPRQTPQRRTGQLSGQATNRQPATSQNNAPKTD